MNIFKVSIYFLIYFLLSACASNHALTVNNTSYHNNKFPQKKFIMTTATSPKKLLSSDHLLMLSLLNRETPKDQLMMLAFANRDPYPSLNNKIGISIKGTHLNDGISYRVKSKYITLIEKDQNAVGINLIDD
jgi:hypothetical protein